MINSAALTGSTIQAPHTNYTSCSCWATLWQVIYDMLRDLSAIICSFLTRSQQGSHADLIFVKVFVHPQTSASQWIILSVISPLIIGKNLQPVLCVSVFGRGVWFGSATKQDRIPHDGANLPSTQDLYMYRVRKPHYRSITPGKQQFNFNFNFSPRIGASKHYPPKQPDTRTVYFHRPKTCRLTGDCKLSVGVNVSVNGCLSLCVSPVIV